MSIARHEIIPVIMKRTHYLTLVLHRIYTPSKTMTVAVRMEHAISIAEDNSCRCNSARIDATRQSRMRSMQSSSGPR